MITKLIRYIFNKFPMCMEQQLARWSKKSPFTEDMFVNYRIRGKLDLHITQIRFWYMYELLKNYKGTFLNVGDTSDILLKKLGVEGQTTDKTIGFDAENLPFADISFDYVICFQCLEHLPNPIKALNGFGRIAKKKVFITIPYVEKTFIQSIKECKIKDKEWKHVLPPQVGYGHIFEFSTEDFKKILSYTNLSCEKNYQLQYFPNDNLFHKFLNLAIEPYFNVFILSKECM